MTDRALRHVMIAVPTAGARPLEPLLRALVTQARSRPENVQVVVLDNGTIASAAVSAAAGVAGAELHHVGSPGVASVRNAALDLAAARGADALLFIDDDELPVDGWLAAHLTTAERFGADVVLGPVPVRVPDDAARWLDDGRVLRTVPDRADGPFDDFVNGGNTLLRMAAVAEGMRFDLAYDGVGGEDVEFFGRLRAAGAHVVWARDAVAVEHQDADRLTLRGYARRLYAVGRRSALVEHATGRTTVTRTFVRRTGRIGRGVGRGVSGLVTGRPETAARGVGDIAMGLGSLSTLVRPRRD